MRKNCLDQKNKIILGWIFHKTKVYKFKRIPTFPTFRKVFISGANSKRIKRKPNISSRYVN